MTLVLALGACSLPRGAAIQTEVTARAEDGSADFAVHAVTRDFLAASAKWPASKAHRPNRWIGRKRGPASTVIKPGDRVAITIWDSEENSLLTAPEQRMVDLKDMLVGPDGSIFVPYLNAIQINGLTQAQARAKLQDEMTIIIPSAQVQLAVTSGRRNAVDLVGGVGRPGPYPLPDRNYTVLNLISAGGGVQPGMRNPQVKLSRDGRIYRTSLARLTDTPAHDTTLRGGDKIMVEEDDRYFVALGASAAENLVYFPKDRVSALEAISLIGGLNDGRADPQGILILREYAAKEVKPGGPSKERVVFTLDLTSSDGLFSAGNFAIQHGDVVLATESPVNAARTVFSLIGSAFGLVNTAQNL